MQPIQYLYLGVAIGILVTGIGAFIYFLHINNDWRKRRNKINESWYDTCIKIAEREKAAIEYAIELENHLKAKMQAQVDEDDEA